MLSLTACATDGTAPIADRSHVPSTQKIYIVKPGDSLYAIAFRFGKDYREIASINGIRAPYPVHVGERISLRKISHKAPVKLKKSRSTKKHIVWHKAKGKTTHKKKTYHKKHVAKKHHYKKHAAKKHHFVQHTAAAPHWHWPVQGHLLHAYHPPRNKGIDITAKQDTPVHAAAPGEVVYAGHGLRGYGNLVIIRHNASYLTAYGHNRSILVKEGQIVKAGQSIARLGHSGTNRNMLHFEIRRNGKPVNPLRYLRKA
ncbi:MAG: peptidase [marine bacterium B5-7]|nr:MAG: peptidase [marine bacterium B5-7]